MEFDYGPRGKIQLKDGRRIDDWGDETISKAVDYLKGQPKEDRGYHPPASSYIPPLRTKDFYGMPTTRLYKVLISIHMGFFAALTFYLLFWFVTLVLFPNLFAFLGAALVLWVVSEIFEKIAKRYHQEWMVFCRYCGWSGRKKQLSAGLNGGICPECRRRVELEWIPPDKETAQKVEFKPLVNEIIQKMDWACDKCGWVGKLDHGDIGCPTCGKKERLWPVPLDQVRQTNNDYASKRTRWSIMQMLREQGFGPPLSFYYFEPALPLKLPFI